MSNSLQLFVFDINSECSLQNGRIEILQRVCFVKTVIDKRKLNVLKNSETKIQELLKVFLAYVAFTQNL